ncbi:MAG: hypothetical protein AUH85_03310 [Chloroflexi bacterium 13_1_40CM_4_68_4]|nr:MAG: hypothetical protein AUH85_03310 [Chloroflexi bacterium 13_1_40CM_4_68_4]
MWVQRDEVVRAFQRAHEVELDLGRHRCDVVGLRAAVTLVDLLRADGHVVMPAGIDVVDEPVGARLVQRPGVDVRRVYPAQGEDKPAFSERAQVRVGVVAAEPREDPDLG